MPTKDGFTPNHPLPLFLANEHQGIGKAWDRAVVSWRVVTAGILLGSATAIGIAIISAGNPVTLFADVPASSEDVTASPVDKSPLQPVTDQSTPTIQSTADAQPLPPTAPEAPTRDEIVAATESSGQSPTENSEHEALFRQFQAWVAEKDAQAQVEPTIQPVEDASAQVAENAQASLRPMQKHRHVRRVRNEPAEIRSVNNRQKKVRREQNARVPVPPVQTARAQDQSVQDPQTPSLLKIFGWRN